MQFGKAHGAASHISQAYAEEQEQPIGFLMAARAEEAIEYERRPANEPG